MQGHNKVRLWFDALEESLRKEAQQAGLLEHSSTVGSAREFLIKRVLRTFLPPIIHIASGKLFDANGNTSRQVDIVVFDSRFPVLEVASGVGLYPIEGVIATIEVKSTLSSKRSVREALENQKAVLDLTPYTKAKEGAAGFSGRIRQLQNETGLGKDEAQRRAVFEWMPAGYVFAFRSRLKVNGLSNAVDKWFEEKGQPTVHFNLCAALPRIVVAEQAVGFLDDGYTSLKLPKDAMQQARKEHGPGVRPLMGFWETERRFGFLAMHVLHTVSTRLGPRDGAIGPVYGFDPYLKDVWDEYMSSLRPKEKESHTLVWAPGAQFEPRK